MQIDLPAVINEYPTRNWVASLDGVRMIGIAVKIARNIHIRCALAEAQNWKCCWCGIKCRPEPNYPDSTTIEHVQPRSLGGADHWDNYAMACAKCNHKRGTLSVEDFMAGNFPQPKKSKQVRRREKVIDGYVKKALKRNQEGWVREDGTPLDKMEWFNSLRIAQDKHRKRILDVLYAD